MKLVFKRELGMSDVIAACALLISVLSLWYTVESEAPHINLSGGPVSVGTTPKSDSSICEFVVQVPVVIDNSGKKSVVLEQLLKIDTLPVVFYSFKDKILSDEKYKFEIYLSRSELGRQSLLDIQNSNALRLDVERSDHISALIKPGSNLEYWLLVYSQSSRVDGVFPDTMYLGMTLKFSDGNLLDLKRSISLRHSSANCT